MQDSNEPKKKLTRFDVTDNGYYVIFVNVLYLLIGVYPLIVMSLAIRAWFAYADTGNDRYKDVATVLGTVGGVGTGLSLLGIGNKK